jgi:hypothetical protein
MKRYYFKVKGVDIMGREDVLPRAGKYIEEFTTRH